MPDKDGVPTPDELFAMTGIAKPTPAEKPAEATPPAPGVYRAVELDKLDPQRRAIIEAVLAGRPMLILPLSTPISADQKKAIELTLSGMPFVMMAMKPTQQEGAVASAPGPATGSDVYTAISGDKSTLLGMKDKFPEVLERQYKKRGLTDF